LSNWNQLVNHGDDDGTVDDPERMKQLTNALGLFSYIDVDANNVLHIDDETIVGTTKAGSVFTIDTTDNTVSHFTTLASIPTSAKGGTASANFGGTCYIGDGLLAVHVSMNEWDFWQKDVDTVLKAKTAHVAAYEVASGTIRWTTEVFDDAAHANGIFCAPGLVFSSAKGGRIVGLDAKTGKEVLSLSVPECEGGAYNCAEVVTDRTDLYLTTSRRFSKHSFARVIK
jgi:outer membrane protein assembly factor BamB